MTAYVLQRLALVPAVAFLVATLVFVLVRLLPGDVVTTLAAEAPQYGAADELRAELGLDRPLPAQYFDFMSGAAVGDFGDSLFFRHPVSDELKRAVPVTIELTLLTLALSFLLALPFGIVAARRQDGWLDRGVRVVASVVHAVPSFWLATIVLTFAGVWFAWTPPLRYVPIWEDPLGNLAQFALPSIVLAVGAFGLLMRLVRNQLIEVLSQDYVRTARAKGVGDGAVIQRHALRNALVPVVSLFGNQAGALIGGAAISETIFNLPGMGRLLVESVANRDYPMIQATVLVIAIFLVSINLLVDLVYAWLNPTIRYR